MVIRSEDGVLYCGRTGTSKKVTAAIAQDGGTVKMLAERLTRISNYKDGIRFGYRTQINKLIELASADKPDAKAIQQCARATKWIFREDYKDMRAYYGPLHAIKPVSRAYKEMSKAGTVCLLSKAIQHNKPCLY